MFAATASRIVARIQPVTAQASRNMSVVSGPPQVRISPAEKLLHGALLVGGMLAVPMWVLVNIKKYRGLD